MGVSGTLDKQYRNDSMVRASLNPIKQHGIVKEGSIMQSQQASLLTACFCDFSSVAGSGSQFIADPQ